MKTEFMRYLVLRPDLGYLTPGMDIVFADDDQPPLTATLIHAERVQSARQRHHYWCRFVTSAPHLAQRKAECPHVRHPNAPYCVLCQVVLETPEPSTS
ncbi:hypothetical protein FT643_21975 [Ketobacter sp. MCCC 1A13808]|uniref:hypothetical protein n=1 Tax=Ketobacter sp. MCCC 1A13808 TaxID=2602738 RepID=UPI0012EBF48E|nr:hypothetical protein [Ketobacter sp. MCCC 1A13808]MVF14809.1 hypothetical protein [Ketobacter sp. MCCC 1A13808]